jgi:putative DNA primase/helicase
MSSRERSEYPPESGHPSHLPPWREREALPPPRERARNPGANPGERLRRPEIETYNRHQRDITRDAVVALIRANIGPILFQQGGRAVRLDVEAAGYSNTDQCQRIVSLDRDGLKAILARVADWRKTTETKTVLVPPPSETVRDLFGLGDWQFLPRLRGVITSPCFAPNGDLIGTPAYHEPSGPYYAPPAGEPEIPLPPPPSAASIRKARRFLQQELLGDFPFADQASGAHALALLLLPCARELIDGPTPLHVVDAPTEGTGKGLLVDACVIPLKPDATAVLTAPTEESEWRKTLTAVLRNGPSHVLLDNLSRPLTGGPLAAVLTALVWVGRILGSSKTVQLPVRCVWAATGNNVRASREIQRRTVWIRLDARMARPAERTGFRHPDLRDWARAARPDLIKAILTLIQGWIVAGCPPGERSIGSYEEWARVMRGILAVAGVDGFLTNGAAYSSRSDPEGEAWEALATLWSERFGTGEVTSHDLFDLAQGLEGMLELIGGGSQQSRRVRFGNLLRTQEDRVYGPWRITATRSVQNARRYRLVAV